MINTNIQVELEKIKKAKEHKDFADLFKLTSNPILALEFAKNENAPLKYLESLSKHFSIVVRTEVAKNKSLSKDHLLKLLSDNDMLVRDSALENLKRKVFKK